MTTYNHGAKSPKIRTEENLLFKMAAIAINCLLLNSKIMSEKDNLSVLINVLKDRKHSGIIIPFVLILPAKIQYGCHDKANINNNVTMWFN